MSLAELEELWLRAEVGEAPSGNFVGRWLTWIESPGAKRLHVRVASGFLFRAMRFGVDFDRGLWWFGRPEVAMGRFAHSEGRSRWRETEAWRLEYSASLLPGPIRDLLYDEVKVLDGDSLIGLGGIARPAGEGDHFFFSLQRI